MRILAIDPGKMSGYVEWWGNVIEHGELRQFEMCSYVARNPVDLVVCESFIITPATIKKTRQAYSLEIIGAVRYICGTIGQKFQLQTPAQAKSFADDARLKRENLWFPTTGGHTNDAARHLCLALARHGVKIPAAA